MLPPSVKIKAQRINIREKSVETIKETVVTEVPVNIRINGQYASTLFALPLQLKELGVGWVLDQGIVKSIDEITEARVEGNEIRINCVGKAETRLKAAKTMRIIDSACGSTTDDFLFLIDGISQPFVKSKYKVKAEKILEFTKILNEKAALFRATGGTHSAAIFHEEKLVGFAEDIGRHNAVDKVIGIAAIKKANFSKCVLASSGRQPANMVLKAARAGIPIVVSIAAPIHTGVKIALKTGVTLICFARGQRMNIYSHPERIETSL